MAINELKQAEPKKARATRVREVEVNGKQGWEYSDGSVRNEKGQAIVQPPAFVEHAITSVNARDMQASAVMKKRMVMMRAANREVPAELIAEYGDYAHVAERAQTLQRIASSPEAGKAAVMAHQALTQDTGMGEKQEQAQTQQLSLADQAIIGLIQAITGKLDVIPIRNVIDGETSEDE